ncbi:MAG: hypothetical protein ACT4OO_08880 [Nitrospiraceae bacterium]
MTSNALLTVIITISSTLLLSACATEEGTKVGSGTSGAAPTAAKVPSTLNAPAKATSKVASGTEDDTLQACIGRIPKDATVGQRMIAEQTCKRDEAVRGEINVVPGR